ncbi:hypothetical protein JD844_028439 [Phrynosoma platyrhinos]|uniref:Apolipoprotein L6 n=1 Tax=Phrynosoma platyrhinos TaxID=52577 RepID=A0ABQ7SI42_PHRPL|nr:hypothetical protein JD844_028439 [Phrynosoma platyrhinos]
MENKHFANFQKEYPAHREEIQKCIRCLYEIADKIDKTSKDWAITDVAVSSAGTTSGILSILGLTLAPFSAGISLILAATGVGLGVAATATDISASVAKCIIDSEDLKKVHALMKECQESIRIVMHADEFDFSPESEVAKFTHKCYKVYDGTKKFQTHVKALKVARANPELAALAQRATAARSAARAAMGSLEEVETAFRGTALAMTRGGRMLKAASAGFFLLYDAYSIVQGALHLAEGAKTAVAAEIRERASKLEEVLQDLDKLHKELNKRY